VAVHEPLLHIMLFPEEARLAELLKLQHCQPMRLRRVYYCLIKYLLRNDLRHTVEYVCNGPVEYLGQERELLKYATVNVV